MDWENKAKDKKGEGKRRVKKEEMLGKCTPTDFSSSCYKKTGNVRVQLMRVRVTNVAVEKQHAINIMSASVFLHYLAGMQSACAV